MDYYIANRWEVAEAVLGISPSYDYDFANIASIDILICRLK